MNRTLTVKGTGKLSIKPDLTLISLSLRNVDKDYNKAMIKAAKTLDALREALTGIGFDKDDLKTTNFNVNTEYDSKRDKNGDYKQVFVGYAVSHGLKLEFDFDTKRLSETLGAIAGCIAEPELYISFSVKDKDAVSAALLESACENAKAKAEILAKASRVKLGELISIDYSWGDLRLISPTRYEMEDRCMLKACGAPEMSIAPDDIDVSDNVTFVWEIE